MSDSNHFIDEVSEELRRDRLFGAIRKYGWIAVLIVVLLVAAAAWNEWRQSQARAEARAFGDEIVAALDNDSPEARREALLAIEAEGTRQALVAMLAADTLDDPEARSRTAGLLDEISSDESLPQLYREMAVLKSAMIELSSGEPQAVIDRLDPLTIPGAPYRLLALEQQALAQLELGETDTALEILQEILSDGAAPRDLQSRTRQLIVALGGSLEAA